MRPIIFTIIFFGATIKGVGQPDATLQTKLPKQQVKLSFTDIIDPFSPTIMVSYEHFFGDNFSILAEGGYVTTFNGKWILGNKMDGFKLRGELRFFIDSETSGDRFYLGLQGLFKHTEKLNLNGDFCRDNCAYTQRLPYSFVKYAGAGHISLGFLLPISEHIVTDISGFGGFRYIVGKYGSIPEDAVYVASFSEDNITFDQEGGFFVPSIGLLLRFGFGW
jgi:hypothetical protein